MPIYEYSCKKCGNEFELLVFGEGNQAACDKCGSKSVTKKFSTFAVQNGPTTGATPECAPSCGSGYSQGTCGSGMCRGGR